jgi:hypothetical protein
MMPEWCSPPPLDFQEEDSRDTLYLLDKVLADEEAALEEAGAGADPSLRVRPVCIIIR